MKAKLCTDVNQSKHLVELGLDADTADMWYLPIKDTYELVTSPSLTRGIIPAWSLSALLRLMPQFTLNGFCNGKFNCRDERVDNYALVDSNPLDAVYSMVVLLIQQGYIKTEKK